MGGRRASFPVPFAEDYLTLGNPAATPDPSRELGLDYDRARQRLDSLKEVPEGQRARAWGWLLRWRDQYEVR